ncbi:MAG: M23 family metallopeptidase, partial [Oscillospiraceae bacterium]|nr:M23 family metallopeptidase [Oscillospiraceae bacterium]
VISSEKDSTDGFGNYVKIKGIDGREYLYAHLFNTSVSVGDKINSGTPIGIVGSSGNSTGPHLHLEVKENGKYVDPYPIIMK